MPNDERDVAHAARRIVDELELAGIDYAIGGALAYSYYGVPRATNDIDLNVFLSAFATPELIAAFRAAGCELDEAAAERAVSSGNDFGARCMGWRVDVFPPTLPVHESARERVRQHSLLGRPAWFLSAEDLVVFKMLHHRTQDLADLERLFAVRGDALELRYVRDWLCRLLAPGDPRVKELDEIALRARGS